MPTYEYRCKTAECSHITEKTCKFQERYDSPECEKCGGETEQIISTTSFVLQGTGWARDGYGKQPAKGKKP